MQFINLSSILAMAPTAQPGQQSPPFWTSLVPLILLIVVFYFALIRPQQKKAKDHTRLLKTVRPGDKILSNGGILGVVITVKEKSVTLRSGDAKMEITKSAITEILERSGDASDS